MSKYQVIGKSVPRVDAPEKVTGRAQFAVDFKLPGMLYGKAVRSPYPHAKIISIDTSKAEKLPGVRAVVTAKDIPEARTGMYLSDRYALPSDNIVRSIGEPVAAVAADTIETAEKAVELVEVKYEELPGVYDTEEAFSTEPCAIVHPDLPNYELLAPMMKPSLVPERPNVNQHYWCRQGDVEKGFKEADFIVENRYATARICHCQPEPHMSTAWVKGDGTLVVRTTTQGVYLMKAALCAAFHLPSSKVEVQGPYAGCGLGGKTWLITEHLSAMLTMKASGRPVQVSFTREEVFITCGQRVPIITYVKDGVKKDGTIIAREVTMLVDTGAYANIAILIVKNACFGLVGTYNIPNFKVDSYGVYTNTPLTGAFRGFGSAESTWPIENQMDIMAERIGMNPVELRMKNLLKEGDINAMGQVTQSIGVRECLQRVAECIEWGKKPSEEPGSWKRGKGIAIGNKYTLAGTGSTCVVKLHSDGVIEVRHSEDEMGQGLNTVLTQMVAEEFGVSTDRVKVVRGDTAITPAGGGSISSRSTFHTGNAAVAACRDVKRQLFDLAAQMMGVPANQLESTAGKIRMRGGDGKEMSITELFSVMGFVLMKGEISGTGSFYSPVLLEDESGRSPRMCTSYSHGAYAVEVAVNVETGEVKIVKHCGCFDMGQPINPKMCEQQIEGGMLIGVGSSLFEEVVLEKGKVLNPCFTDYKQPTTAEMPTNENVISMIAGVRHEDGPYGAKGLGELTMVPYAPAVANAIYNAIGVRMKDIPMTPEKILKTLNEKRAGKA